MITSLRRSQLFNVIPSTIDFTRNHSTAEKQVRVLQIVVLVLPGLAATAIYCEVRPSQSMAPRGSPLYLHSACTQRATLSLPIMDWTWATALRSSTVGRSSRVVQAARSVSRTRSSSPGLADLLELR
jgi:hypothetical protein